MLNLLHIENIAVIEQAEIQFEPGFNVMTGETGAGKSIVIDAISAILGERAYRDVIRTGAHSAFVSAVFSKIPQFPWFEENSVTYDAEELHIQREIFADGVGEEKGIQESYHGIGYREEDAQQRIEQANQNGNNQHSHQNDRSRVRDHIGKEGIHRPVRCQIQENRRCHGDQPEKQPSKKRTSIREQKIQQVNDKAKNNQRQ